MPVDEDSDGYHDAVTTAASVLPPSMTKSLSYMSSTSNSSYSTSNTGECDVIGQPSATSVVGSGCLSRGADERAPVREVHRVTFAEDRNKYLNADEQLCDGLDFELELRLSGHRASDDDDVELIPRHSIIKLPKPPSPENHENPFIADGELRRKADYIIQYSTISRRRIRIADPDCTPPPQLDSQRDAGSSSISQPAPESSVELTADAVTLQETVPPGSDSTWPTTGLGDGEDRGVVDHQRQQTPSPTAAAAAGDVDGKAETSTTELDRPTTSLLHGGTSGSSTGRRGRCRCCVVQ